MRAQPSVLPPHKAVPAGAQPGRAYLFDFVGIVNKQQIGSSNEPGEAHNAPVSLVQQRRDLGHIRYGILANDGHQTEEAAVGVALTLIKIEIKIIFEYLNFMYFN